jgi:ATP-dependent Clp protease ATP-binding subunit ClpX
MLSLLDEYVVGQMRAKKVLSVAVYNHYKRISGGASAGRRRRRCRVGEEQHLAHWPDGLRQDAARPHAGKASSMCLSRSRMQLASPRPATSARTWRTFLSSLLHAAEWDVERASVGIVYVDEIDKIARKSGDESVHHA